jgi:hypothetical protein
MYIKSYQTIAAYFQRCHCTKYEILKANFINVEPTAEDGSQLSVMLVQGQTE